MLSFFLDHTRYTNCTRPPPNRHQKVGSIATGLQTSMQVKYSDRKMNRTIPCYKKVVYLLFLQSQVMNRYNKRSCNKKKTYIFTQLTWKHSVQHRRDSGLPYILKFKCLKEKKNTTKWGHPKIKGKLQDVISAECIIWYRRQG